MKFMMVIILLIAMGGGGFFYTEELKKSFKEKEEDLLGQIRRSKKLSNAQAGNSEDIKKQLETEFKSYKKQLEDKFMLKDKSLQKKYGVFEDFKQQLLDGNKALDKSLNDREKDLAKVKSEVDSKAAMSKKRLQETDRKLKKLTNINMECKIFDLKKIEDYLKEFQNVAYATKDKSNMLCGFDPSSQALASKGACMRGIKDREKARSLLSLIYSLSQNVDKQKSYEDYVNSQRFRMQIQVR